MKKSNATPLQIIYLPFLPSLLLNARTSPVFSLSLNPALSLFLQSIILANSPLQHDFRQEFPLSVCDQRQHAHRNVFRQVVPLQQRYVSVEDSLGVREQFLLLATIVK